MMWTPIPDQNQRSAFVFFLLLFALFFMLPAVTENLYLLSIFMTAYVYIIFVTSWDVFAGYLRLMNFGHALFVGIAGYLTAFLDRSWGASPFIVLASSAILCGLVGMLIGFLTLRLRGPYFAMLTISFAAVAHESSIMFSSITGGEEGIPGISPLTDSILGDYYIVLFAMGLIFVCLLKFTRGRYGLLLKAIGENEDAVLACGINTPFIKTITFAISGALCGIGGSFYTYSLTHVGPTSLSQALSTTILIMAIFGGMGTITGPLIGAFLLITLNELLREVGEFRLLLYTVLVVAMIFFAPKGIVSYARPIGAKIGLVAKRK